MEKSRLGRSRVWRFTLARVSLGGTQIIVLHGLRTFIGTEGSSSYV